jgi:hypothetical protein
MNAPALTSDELLIASPLWLLAGL